MDTALHTGDIVVISNSHVLKNEIRRQTGTILKWHPYIDMYTVLINGQIYGIFTYEMTKTYPHYNGE